MAQDEKHPTEAKPSTEPMTWKDARMQPRVRPQWDPKEKANELLDEMERGGRLFRRDKR